MDKINNNLNEEIKNHIKHFEIKTVKDIYYYFCACSYFDSL